MDALQQAHERRIAERQDAKSAKVAEHRRQAEATRAQRDQTLAAMDELRLELLDKADVSAPLVILVSTSSSCWMSGVKFARWNHSFNPLSTRPSARSPAH